MVERDDTAQFTKPKWVKDCESSLKNNINFKDVEGICILGILQINEEIRRVRIIRPTGKLLMSREVTKIKKSIKLIQHFF